MQLLCTYFQEDRLDYLFLMGWWWRAMLAVMLFQYSRNVTVLSTKRTYKKCTENVL